MFGSKFSFVALVILGSKLPEFLCFEGSVKIEQHDRISRDRCVNGIDEAKIQSNEVKPVPDEKYGDHALFPRYVNGMRENDCDLRKDRQRKDVNHPATHEKKFIPEISMLCLPWLTKSFQQLQKTISRRYSQHFDSTALLECMLDAVEKSLPSVVSRLVSPVKTFLRKVTGLLGGQPTEASIVSPEVLESFIEAVTPCFEYFKRDKSGKLILKEDFATSAAAETIKLRPMGELAIGAAEAIANNVSVTFDKKRKPQYNVDHAGLATGLGIAAVKATKIDQIATNPAEGRNWLPRTISQRIAGSGATTPSNRTPPKLVALLQCVFDAAVASIPLSDLLGQAAGALRDRLTGMLRTDERPDEPAAPPAVDPTNVINKNVLAKFVKAATPCFGLFKHNQDGELVLDQDFATKAAIEAIKLTPVGALALGSTEAIKENVRVTEDKHGNPQYTIDYPGLASGLGVAFIQATKLGRIVRLGSQLASYVGGTS